MSSVDLLNKPITLARKKVARHTQRKNPQSKNQGIKNRKKILLSDDLVSQYLIQNPDFFMHNARLTEEIKIPHPVRGAVSLPEWQLARQRNKIKQLESEITLLMEHASFNEKLFKSLMALQTELLLATELNDLVKRMNRWAKSLGLVGVYLYLFNHKWQIAPPSSYHHLGLSAEKFDFIRVRYFQCGFQYLGPLNKTELDLLIADERHIGSVALSLLGELGDLGLVMFASRHPNHYQTGQGTLLLEKISEVLPILINRWVTRKQD